MSAPQSDYVGQPLQPPTSSTITPIHQQQQPLSRDLPPRPKPPQSHTRHRRKKKQIVTIHQRQSPTNQNRSWRAAPGQERRPSRPFGSKTYAQSARSYRGRSSSATSWRASPSRSTFLPQQQKHAVSQKNPTNPNPPAGLFESRQPGNTATFPHGAINRLQHDAREARQVDKIVSRWRTKEYRFEEPFAVLREDTPASQIGSIAALQAPLKANEIFSMQDNTNLRYASMGEIHEEILNYYGDYILFSASVPTLREEWNTNIRAASLLPEWSQPFVYNQQIGNPRGFFHYRLAFRDALPDVTAIQQQLKEMNLFCRTKSAVNALQAANNISRDFRLVLSIYTSNCLPQYEDLLKCRRMLAHTFSEEHMLFMCKPFDGGNQDGSLRLLMKLMHYSACVNIQGMFHPPYDDLRFVPIFDHSDTPEIHDDSHADAFFFDDEEDDDEKDLALDDEARKKKSLKNFNHITFCANDSAAGGFSFNPKYVSHLLAMEHFLDMTDPVRDRSQRVLWPARLRFVPYSRKLDIACEML